MKHAAMLVMLLVIVGCSSVPTKTETHFFTIETNAVTGEVTFTPNQNSQNLADSGRRIGGLFGPFGELVGYGIAGVLGIWGTLRSRRASAADKRASAAKVGAAVLAQGIETLREVLKSTPQGKLIDDKIMKALRDQQLTAGVLAEIAVLVEQQVDNEDAKRVARDVLEKVKAAQEQ